MIHINCRCPAVLYWHLARQVKECLATTDKGLTKCKGCGSVRRRLCIPLFVSCCSVILRSLQPVSNRSPSGGFSFFASFCLLFLYEKTKRSRKYSCCCVSGLCFDIFLHFYFSLTPVFLFSIRFASFKKEVILTKYIDPLCP